MMQSGVQQINLYLPELRPRRDLVTAARFVQVIAVMIAVMMLFGTFNLWQRSAVRSDLAEVQALVAVQTARTEQVERDVAARATDQILVSEMNAREQRIAQSRELYDFMNTSNLGNLNGFSAHLMDFSRASFPGLWITALTISGNAHAVSLRGNAQEAAMLPDYVSRLAAGQSEIRNKRFGRLSTTLASAESGTLYQFVLETN
ncbi:MAG: hypothetical protein Q7W55_01250 [Pseudohongiella sp.]|nr:hypothetical protein [Pseudohongiella sp.]